MFDAIFPKHWTTLQRLMWLKTNALARAVYETITGNPVSFTAKAAPLRKLKVAFSPVQEGTGDPSPDNVRPISGWSSLEVEQRGKNLFDPSKVETGKWLNLTTGEIENAAGYAVSDYIFVKAGQAYTITQPNSIRRWFYDLSKNPLSLMENVTTFTPTQDCYIRITLRTNLTPVDTYMVIMGNTLPSEFAPYNPSSRSISISLGETVYSGWVDVCTGVGEVTWAAVDLGSLTWVYEPTNKYFYSSTITSQLYNPFNYQSHEQGILSDRFVVPDIAVGAADSLWATMPTNTIAKHCGAKNYIYLKKTEYTSPLDLQAAVTGSQLVFKLATPQSIQLTPQEVESLAGDNTMWTDAQNLEVTYRSN